MDNIRETFNEYFDRLYKKDGYLDKYGGSVVLTGITLLIFGVIFSHYYVQHKLEPIRLDWNRQRCNPAVMPFAGWINKLPPGKDKLEFMAENFYQCTTNILKQIIKYFLAPIYYIVNLLKKVFNLLLKAVDMIRVYMMYLRLKLTQIFSYLVARIVNVVIPLQLQLGKIRDTLGKVAGTMTAGLYTVYGGFLAMKSMIGALIDLCIIALIALASAIIAAWLIIFKWPWALAATIFFIILAIMVIIVMTWMIYILDISEGNVPPVGCFDKNTVIKTLKGKIHIKKLKSGMILKNGDKVTATFKVALNNMNVYNLNRIIVTGNHKVFHDTQGWIDVSDHPESVKIEKYREPVVYCFSTESKRFKIRNYKFLDWDDLEPIDIMKLKNLNYLKKNSSLSDIHKYLESGIHGDTMIELENGQSVKLKNISVNDQLIFGERVLAKVEIDTKNIDKVRKYLFHNFSIISSPNIHFKDSDLGNFSTLNIQGEEVPKPKKLYHLITNTGNFTIDGYKIRDYNSAIENIIDIRNKLFALF